MRIPISKVIADPFEVMSHHSYLMKLELKHTRKIMDWQIRCFFFLMAGIVVFALTTNTPLKIHLAVTIIGAGLTLFFLAVSLFIYPPLETWRKIHEKAGLQLEKQHPDYLSPKYFEILLETKFSRFVLESFMRILPLIFSGGTSIFGIVILCMQKSLTLASLVGSISSLSLILVIFLTIKDSIRRKKIILSG